jgi:tetratricopeptide (TPR) repeat protein
LGVLAAVGAGGTYYVWDEIHPAAPAPVPIPGVPGAAGGVIGKANPSGTPVSPPPAAPSASAEVAKPAIDAGTPQIAASGAVATTAEGTAQDARTAGSASAAAMVAAKPAAGGHTSSSASKSTPAPAPGIGTLPASSTEPQGRRERRPTGGNAAIASGGTPVTSPSGLRVTLDRAVPAIDPAVSAGYTALAEGNVEAAREHYARALANDGNNRDALLGMATVALRSGRAEAAEGLFQKLLELHPRDAYANAQLAALRGGDASTSESHVKSLLAGEKDAVSAAPLNFNLGNQFAAQGRWSEAQQAYFNAFTGEPDNPDYCYNLAVSLDQLHQPKLAHEHYVRALGLAQKRRAGFDQARAKARIEQLAASAK